MQLRPPLRLGTSTPTPTDYEWSDTNCVDRYFLADFSSTDYTYTTEKLGHVFTAAGTHVPLSGIAGPSGGNLTGIRSSYATTGGSTDGNKLLYSLSTTEYDLAAGDNFSILYQFKSPTDQKGNTSNIYLWDLTSEGATYRGVAIEHSISRWRVYVVDNAGVLHSSLWGNGGPLWKDGVFYTVVWRFDRSLTKATLSYKAEGGSWVNVPAGDVSISGSNLSALGAITFSGSTNPRLAIMGYNSPSNMILGFTGTLYQFAFAKNLTYLPTTVP